MPTSLQLHSARMNAQTNDDLVMLKILDMLCWDNINYMGFNFVQFS